MERCCICTEFAATQERGDYEEYFGRLQGCSSSCIRLSVWFRTGVFMINESLYTCYYEWVYAGHEMH
jgi:hypothetical protein